MKDVCDVYCNDEEKVRRVQQALEILDMERTVGMLKALNEPNRLKIAYALSKEEELCVCDAANIIGSSIASASHHLRYLKKAGLADFRKKGKLVFYYLIDEHVQKIIENTIVDRREVVS